MSKLQVTLSGVQLANPVIPASGTYGFGDEFAELYDINCLGGISFKGTTRQARYGNALPRIAECGNYGMINAVGLQNPGVEHVIAHELPRLKSHYNGCIVANVSGFSVQDYVETCALLD
jgi:dihydroorotate dehydrogenase (NAD+) catalytic subunit